MRLKSKKIYNFSKKISYITIVLAFMLTIFNIFFADDLGVTGNWSYTYILCGVFFFLIATEIIIWYQKKRKKHE